MIATHAIDGNGHPHETFLSRAPFVVVFCTLALSPDRSDGLNRADAA
jgi:hypothetical protein